MAETSKKAQGKRLIKRLISQCRKQRKANTTLTVSTLAQKLGLTPNHLSAIESGRTVPSLPTLIDYLLELGFDTQPLESLTITKSKSMKADAKTRVALQNATEDFAKEELLVLLELAGALRTLRSAKVRGKRKK